MPLIPLLGIPVSANSPGLFEVERVSRVIGFDPRQYGAASDNLTNDDDAIARCLADIAMWQTAGVVCAYRQTGGIGYAHASPIVIPTGVDVQQDVPSNYIGGLNVAALTIGAVGSTNYKRKLTINVIRGARVVAGVTVSTPSNWLDEASVGALIINANDCDINLVGIEGFTRGVVFLGSNHNGCEFNTIRAGRLTDCRYPVDFRSENTGWSNENDGLGGDFGVITGVNSTVTRYGIRFSSGDGVAVPNHNTWRKASFQLNYADLAGGAESIPVLWQYGTLNKILDCRIEGCGQTGARITGTCSRNTIDPGYFGGAGVTGAVMLIDDQSTTKSTFYRSPAALLEDVPGTLIFESGPMHKQAVNADGAGGSVNVANVHVGHRTGADAITGAVMQTGITLNARYLELANPAGVGVFIDTSVAKRFVVRGDFEAGFGGRVIIVCYDVAGNVLPDTAPVYTDAGTMGVGTNWTGAGNTAVAASWSVATDSVLDRAFIMPAASVYARVILAYGTAVLRVRSFGIWSVDRYWAGKPSAWTGFEDIAPRNINVGSAVPTSGTYAVGKKIYNSAPAHLGSIGWVCTAAGTPGTWLGFGAIL